MLWHPHITLRCSGKNFFQRISTPDLDNPLMLWNQVGKTKCMEDVIGIYSVQFIESKLRKRTLKVKTPILCPFLTDCL